MKPKSDGEIYEQISREAMEKLNTELHEDIRKSFIKLIKEVRNNLNSNGDLYIYCAPDFWVNLQNGYEGRATKKRQERPWYRKGRW